MGKKKVMEKIENHSEEDFEIQNIFNEDSLDDLNDGSVYENVEEVESDGNENEETSQQ